MGLIRTIPDGTRVLTLWQPWASFMVWSLRSTPPKSVETRPRRMNHRGLLAIHAAKSEPSWVRKLFCGDELRRTLMLHHFRSRMEALSSVVDVFRGLPRGSIVGTVDVFECVRTDHVDIVGLGPDNLLLGDYSPGRFAIATRDPRRLVRPIPAKGRQGLWTYSTEDA